MSTTKQTYDSDEAFAQALLSFVTQRTQEQLHGKRTGNDKVDLNVKFTVHYAKDASDAARMPEICCICVNDGGVIICKGPGHNNCCPGF